MTFDIKHFLQLKDSAQKKRRDLDRAQGELDSLLVRLQQVAGCNSIEEGNNRIKHLMEELELLQVTYNKKLTVFSVEFGGEL